jgi:hypothetical protein
MNNRIEELAKQAEFNPVDYMGSKKILFEKLTELIIQDCCQAIMEWKKEPFPFDEDLAVELIYKNFGMDLPPKYIKVIKI